MVSKLNAGIAVIGIDIGKNSFHVVGHDKRGAIMLGKNGRAGRWRHGWPTCRVRSSSCDPPLCANSHLTRRSKRLRYSIDLVGAGPQRFEHVIQPR